MATLYDSVPYPSLPVPQAHPDRLAVIARLHGVKTASIENARVLELGCGDGSHLLPLAVEYPGSEFIGVDLAENPINSGLEVKRDLGLKNIQLRAMSVMDVDQSFGKFDYILVHGLYSWVPPHVQDRILDICGAHIKTPGLAYVSYNAYPGCHQREMLRFIMRFHTRNIEEPAEKLKKALGFIARVANYHPSSDSFEVFIREELKRYSKMNPHTIYHDDLAEIYLPESIFGFCEKARRRGLMYLAEADEGDNVGIGLSDEVLSALDELAGDDVVLREQYKDIFRNRKFRQTLLCPEGSPVRHPAQTAAVNNFWISTSFRAPKNVDYAPGVAVEFTDRDKAITMGNSFTKAALTVLSERLPESVSFADLLRLANERVHGDPGSADLLADFLLSSFRLHIVELRTRPLHVVSSPGERPAVSAYVRVQVARGYVVTTQRHTTIEVEGDQAAAILQLLDGTLDRTELTAAMKEQFPSVKIDEEEVWRTVHGIAQMALLVA